MNLLIIEDDITALESMMSDIDWVRHDINGNIWTAHNTSQAEEILERETIDIILCEIEVSGMSGIEFMRKVLAKNQDIAIIFMTSHASFENAQEALRLGCVDCILVPTSFETIADAVRRASRAQIEKRNKMEMEKLGARWLSQQEKKIATSQNAHRGAAEIIRDIEDYVSANIGSKDLTVKSLARRNFMNEDYLSRIFKREKGISLRQYIIGERMKLAVRLLQTPTLKTVAIAEEVGYSNYNHFASTFKKFFGRTPAQYRKEF